MTLKAVLVLAALALLAGMLRRRFAPPSRRPRGPVIEAAQKCPSCGAYVLAGAPCARPDCPPRG